EVAAISAGVEGVRDLYRAEISGTRQLVVHADRTAIARHGVSIENLSMTLNAAFSGLHAGLVYEGEKRFSLVVRMEEKNRTDIEDVRNLRVPAKNGMLIPLDQLAKVDWEDSPIQIQ